MNIKSRRNDSYMNAAAVDCRGGLAFVTSDVPLTTKGRVVH